MGNTTVNIDYKQAYETLARFADGAINAYTSDQKQSNCKMAAGLYQRLLGYYQEGNMDKSYAQYDLKWFKELDGAIGYRTYQPWNDEPEEARVVETACVESVDYEYPDASMEVIAYGGIEGDRLFIVKDDEIISVYLEHRPAQIAEMFARLPKVKGMQEAQKIDLKRQKQLI